MKYTDNNHSHCDSRHEKADRPEHTSELSTWKDPSEEEKSTDFYSTNSRAIQDSACEDTLVLDVSKYILLLTWLGIPWENLSCHSRS